MEISLKLFSPIKSYLSVVLFLVSQLPVLELSRRDLTSGASQSLWSIREMTPYENPVDSPLEYRPPRDIGRPRRTGPSGGRVA